MFPDNPSGVLHVVTVFGPIWRTTRARHRNYRPPSIFRLRCFLGHRTGRVGVVRGWWPEWTAGASSRLSPKSPATRLSRQLLSRGGSEDHGRHGRPVRQPCQRHLGCTDSIVGRRSFHMDRWRPQRGGPRSGNQRLRWCELPNRLQPSRIPRHRPIDHPPVLVTGRGSLGPGRPALRLQHQGLGRRSFLPVAYSRGSFDYADGLTFAKMERSPLVEIVPYPDYEPVAGPGFDCSGPVAGPEPSNRHGVAGAETCPNHQGVLLCLLAMLFFQMRVPLMLLCHVLSLRQVRGLRCE